MLNPRAARGANSSQNKNKIQNARDKNTNDAKLATTEKQKAPSRNKRVEYYLPFIFFFLLVYYCLHQLIKRLGVLTEVEVSPEMIEVYL